MLKTAVVYLVLVGVPLLGLFGVLRWGAAIEPTAHVGGAWSIEQACSAMPEEPVIVVDQSGRFLRAKLSDGTAGRGRLDGDRLTVTFTATEGACAGQELAIDARVEPERLVGTIESATCCPASPFVAGREKAGD